MSTLPPQAVPPDVVAALNGVGFVLVSETEQGCFRFRRPSSNCEVELTAKPSGPQEWMIRLARQCPGGPWEVQPLAWLGSAQRDEAIVSASALAGAFPDFLARFVIPVLESHPFAAD